MKSLLPLLVVTLLTAACSDAGEARMNRNVNAALDSTGNKLERLGDRIDTKVKEAVADARAPKDAVDSANGANDLQFKADDARRSDARWATKAAAGSLLEVELGNLAATNATAAPVKALAKRLVADHTGARTGLQALATAKGIRLPADLSSGGRDKLMELTQKTGAEFDQAYTDFLVSDHRDLADQYADMADHGHDPDLRSFAAKKVPTLKHHLQAAEETRKAIDGTK